MLARELYYCRVGENILFAKLDSVRNITVGPWLSTIA
jgi:hypothetical protein